MKVAFFILALFSLRAAQVAAEDGWHDGLSDSDHKQSPRPDDSQYDERPGQDKSKTQVLWGPCGGYYYTGQKKCPPGSYCRWFSDWYSQCNPIGD